MKRPPARRLRWIMLFAALVAAPHVHSQPAVRVSAEKPGGVQSGSGFFLCPEGKIVTAYHLVKDADRVNVLVEDRWEYDVTVDSIRPGADLAVLTLDGSGTGLPCYTKAPSSNTLGAGVEVFIAGIPPGLNNRLWSGRITNDGYLQSAEWVFEDGTPLFTVPDLDLIALDIPAEPGFHGGAVLDDSGRVIGVFSGSLGRESGVAWAVPIEYTDPGEMIPVNRRASAITMWPDLVIVNVDDVAILEPGTAKNALPLRRRLEGLIASTDRLTEAARRARIRNDSLLDSTVDPLRTVGRAEAGESHLLRMEEVLDRVLNGPMMDLASRQEQDSAAFMNEINSTLGRIRADHSALPATRRNVSTYRSLGRDIRFLSESMADESSSVPAEIVQFVLDTSATMGSGELGTYDMLRASIDLYDGFDAMIDWVVSPEQSMFLRRDIRRFTSLIEIFESYETFAWDAEYDFEYYEHHDIFSIVLSDGWLVFDDALRDSVLGPGASMPDTVQLIKFGTIDFNIPAAFTSVFWDPSVTTGPDPQQEEIDRIWESVDDEIAAIEMLEGAEIRERNDYQTVYSEEVLLEVTGRQVLLDSGRSTYFYFGGLVTSEGMVIIACNTTGAYPEYDLGRSLIDMVFLY